MECRGTSSRIFVPSHKRGTGFGVLYNNINKSELHQIKGEDEDSGVSITPCERESPRMKLTNVGMSGQSLAFYGVELDYTYIKSSSHYS